MADRPSLAGTGHDDDRWRRWPAPRRWPHARLPRAGHVLVIAPHPDDAVLAVGGLLHLLTRHNVTVELLAVTDGEASHPHSPTMGPAALRRRRIEETHRAFAALAVPLAREHRLGLPDGAVTDHVAELRRAVVSAARTSTLVLAPWWHDGHPDHDATGQAVQQAMVALPDVRAWYFPVWAWHWADPDDLERTWRGARRVDLPAQVRQVKAAAVRAHRSQLVPLSDAPGDEAIVPPPVRARFERSWETVLT